MEKSYKVICYSKWRFAIFLLVSIFSLIPVTVFCLRFGIWGHIFIGFWLIIIMMLSLFILPKFVSKAVLLISIDTECIQFDWIKPYWGSKPKQTQRVNLDELKSYKYEYSYNFNTLKLRFKSGRKIRLHRWYNDCNDDFDKFMTQFKRTIESYNKKKSTTVVIEKEKLIMENRIFLITMGLVIGAMVIATILLLIFKGVSNIKGVIPIFIVLGPLIWVIIQIVKGLKKGKN